MSAARIGKITLKNGGATVRLLHQANPNHGGEENWAGKLMGGARRAIEQCGESGPITGYLLVAFYADESTVTSFRWGDESPVNRGTLPAYVAEVVRRDVITEPEARAVFNEMFERT